MGKLLNEIKEAEKELKSISSAWVSLGIRLDAVNRSVAELKRKPGRWIDACDTKGVEYYRCTECGTYIEKIFFGFDYDVNFCPNCGKPMERGDDNEREQRIPENALY